MGDQPLDAGAVGGLLEVGGKAFLVSVDRVKEGAIALKLQIRDVEPAAKVAALRALDLDDTGAHVGQP